MKKQTHSAPEAQPSALFPAQIARLDRVGGIWLLCMAVLLPLCNLFGLQALYQAGWREFAYGMLTGGGKTLLYVLLEILTVVIDLGKALPLFFVLATLCLRGVYVPKNRRTKRGLWIAMAALLLLPYLSSLLLASVFDTTLSGSDLLFLSLSALLNWAMDWVVVCLAMRFLHRAPHTACREAATRTEVLPRRENAFLRLLYRVTLASFFVRLTLCLFTTVTDLLSIGAPRNLSEVATLLSPYLSLAAQTIIGYLFAVLVCGEQLRAAMRKK